jgi:hypothetical protein
LLQREGLADDAGNFAAQMLGAAELVGKSGHQKHAQLRRDLEAGLDQGNAAEINNCTGAGAARKYSSASEPSCVTTTS